MREPMGTLSNRAAAALLALACAMVLAAGAAHGHKKDDGKEALYTVSTGVGKKLTPALEALRNEQYDVAEELLLELESRADRFEPYERALIYQMLGYLRSGQDRPKEALDWFERSVAEEALPPQEQLQTTYNVAQLSLATEQFPEAVAALEHWFDHKENPPPNAYYMLAVARYQAKDVEGAIEPAETAVRMATKVEERWLQLLVGLYYETSQFDKAREPLEALIMLKPRKVYWAQLSSLYAYQGEEPRSLATMQIAYDEGFLETDRELRQLAQLLLYEGIPHRAAQVLQKGLDDGIVVPDEDAYAMLANSLLLAKEYDAALPPLRTAAGMSKEGNLDARLGQVLLDREAWQEAESSLTKALEKGDLHDAGSTNLMLGIALYHQKKLADARRYFATASQSDTSQESARKWILLVDREVQDG